MLQLHKLPGMSALTGRLVANTTSPATALKDKLNGTVDPALTDDNTGGYAIGSLWVNVTARRVFYCIDATTNAAIWIVGGTIKEKVTATAHGLTGADIGKAIKRTNAGAGYALAKADSQGNAAVVGVLESVPDANSLVIVETGRANIPSNGFTAGDTLWLSASSAGVLTTTVPNTAGQIQKLVGLCLDANTILVQVGGSIPVGATSGVLPIAVVTGNTNTAVNNGYVANNAGQLVFTLPATSAVGSVLKLVGMGAGGWLIRTNAAAAAQKIHFGDQDSSTSSSSNVSLLNSTGQYDAVDLVCIVADSEWVVMGCVGVLNLT